MLRGSAWRRKAGRAAWRRGPRHGLAEAGVSLHVPGPSSASPALRPRTPPRGLHAPPLAPRPFCSVSHPLGSLPRPLRVHSPPHHVLEQVGRGHWALSPGLGTRGSLRAGRTWRLPEEAHSPTPPGTSGTQSLQGSRPAFSDGSSLEVAQGTEGRLGGRRGRKTRPGSAALGRRVSRQRGTPEWSETELTTECPSGGPATPARTPGLCELPEEAGSHSHSSSVHASPTLQACVQSVHTWCPSHTASLCPDGPQLAQTTAGVTRRTLPGSRLACGSQGARHPPVGTSQRLQRDPTLHRADAHLALLVHVILVGRPGIHVGDGMQQQLRYLDALLPGEGGRDVERGQGPQLQRKHRR